MILRVTTLALILAGAQANASEGPEREVYCNASDTIEYRILGDTDWNVELRLNGETQRAMTAYSFFGNYPAPENFEVALLPENGTEILVFTGEVHYLEYDGKRWDVCN